MADVRIEEIRICELEAFAERMYERSGPSDLNPMPKHFARALANNPYAGPDDVAQFVLFDGERCVGYCSSVPGRLRRGDELHEVAYVSTLFIHPEYRNLVHALKLMRTMYDRPIDVAEASMSAQARVVLQRLRVMGDLGPRTDDVLELNRVRFKLNGLLARAASMLRAERLETAAVGVNERLVYPAVRALFYLVLGLVGRRGPRDVRFEEGDRVPDDALEGAFAPGSTAFHRGVELVNWRLQYPWVLSETDTDDRYPNYYFPAVIPLFRMFVVNLYDRGRNRHRGFVVISIAQTGTNTTMKLLDHHFHDPADRACITRLVATYGRRYGVDRVYMGSANGAEIRRNRWLAPLMAEIVHEYAASPASEDSPLALFADDIELDSCDCDMAFT